MQSDRNRFFLAIVLDSFNIEFREKEKSRNKLEKEPWSPDRQWGLNVQCDAIRSEQFFGVIRWIVLIWYLGMVLSRNILKKEPWS